MLTRDFVFGMNALTVIGFVMMMTGINLSRTRRIRPPLAYALMGIGTVLVFAGVYTMPASG